MSIVNWVKGKEDGLKRLFIQEGNDISAGWRHMDLDRIGPSLSFSTDVTKAGRIEVNARQGGCYQGQTHGHKAFLLDPLEAKRILAEDKAYQAVLKPFMTSDDLVGDSRPSRYVIDFSGLDLLEAKGYPRLFARVQSQVLPAREKAAKLEQERNEEVLASDPSAKVNHHHANFLRKWWQMSYPREDMMKAIGPLKRYIACGQVTKRPIFDFISTAINPNAALMVFAHEDDYSFGILQSGLHWEWFIERCSTIKSDPRYTSNTVFDSFPWPQDPTLASIKKVAKAARDLRDGRRHLRQKHDLSYRELYRTLELPGAHPMKELQATLDEAVRQAYGLTKKGSALPFLLKLNQEVVGREKAGKSVLGPGLPKSVKNRAQFISADCIVP